MMGTTTTPTGNNHTNTHMDLPINCVSRQLVDDVLIQLVQLLFTIPVTEWGALRTIVDDAYHDVCDAADD